MIKPEDLSQPHRFPAVPSITTDRTLQSAPACHCGGAAKIAELEGEIRRLKVEMEVRLNPPVNIPEHPESCVLPSIWREGFVEGWIGQKLTAASISRSWKDGYRAGTAAREAEVDRQMKLKEGTDGNPERQDL